MLLIQTTVVIGCYTENLSTEMMVLQHLEPCTFFCYPKIMNNGSGFLYSIGHRSLFWCSLLVGGILFLAPDFPDSHSSWLPNPFLFLFSRPRRMLSFGETHKYPSGNYSKGCIMFARKRSSRPLNACCLNPFQYDGILTSKNYKLGTVDIAQW